MGVKVYFSSDAGAPSLTGEVGTLVGLLKKCLVDGYGTKAPLGWEGMYNGDYTRAAFRAPAGTRFWLHVDDTGPSAQGARLARFVGYEGIGGLDANGDPIEPLYRFPTVEQRSFGCPVAKSTLLSSDAVNWLLVGDEQAFYLWVAWSSNLLYASTHYGGCFFGDVASYRADDAYHCAIVGSYNTEGAVEYPRHSGGVVNTLLGQGSTAFSAAQTGHYLARGWDQAAPSIPFGKMGDLGVTASWGRQPGYPYPNPADGAMLVVPVVVSSVGPALTQRGLMPGLYQPLHQQHVPHRGEYRDTGELGGRTLLAVSTGHQNSLDANTGRVMLDITGPWR